jgi:hypothetical protein
MLLQGSMILKILVGFLFSQWNLLTYPIESGIFICENRNLLDSHVSDTLLKYEYMMLIVFVHCWQLFLQHFEVFFKSRKFFGFRL